MAIGHVELMHACFLKHTRMGTARMKQDIETEEESEKRAVNMESSTAASKINLSRRLKCSSSLPFLQGRYYPIAVDESANMTGTHNPTITFGAY